MFKEFSKRVKKAFYPKKPPTNWMAYSRVAFTWLVVGFCSGLLLIVIGIVLVAEGGVKPVVWFVVGVLGFITLYWAWIALDDAKKDGLFALLGGRARELWLRRSEKLGIKGLQEALDNFNKKGDGKGGDRLK